VELLLLIALGATLFYFFLIVAFHLMSGERSPQKKTIPKIKAVTLHCTS
jgi:hypothetical protein